MEIFGDKNCSWLESGILILMSVLLDHLIVDVAPKALFGTSDIPTVPTLIKRALNMVALTWTSMPMAYWLRKQLNTKKIPE